MRKHLLWALAGCLSWTSAAHAQAPSGAPRSITDVGIPVIVDVEDVAPTGPGAAPLLVDSATDDARAIWPRIWGSAEYQLWWVRNNPIPPLVTAGTIGVLAPGAGTQILVGDSIDYHGIRGGRTTLGGWCCRCPQLGWEVSGFLTENRFHTSAFADATLAAPPTLHVPVVVGGVETATIPLDSARVASQLQMWSAEANVLWNWRRTPCWSFDVLAGFRYFELDESLTLAISSTLIGQAGFDNFRARNQYYGGQIGFKTSYQRDRFNLDLIGKVALGQNHRVLENLGLNFNGATVDRLGNLFVNDANLGRFTNNQFSVLPEMQVKVGYDVAKHVRLTAGYNFLLMSNVARAGRSIDREVDLDPTRPSVRFGNNGFWAHGVSAGVEFRW